MRNHKGFSIVELMIAMLLGLLLMGGVIQVLTGSQGSYNELVQQARMQETAKIALDYIVRDLRNVGYFGCNGSAMQVANSIDNTSSYYFDINDVLEGWDEDETGIPTKYSGIVEDSSVLEMRLIDISNALTVKDHNPDSARISFNGPHPYPSGTVWTVVDRDCSNIGIFVQSGPTNCVTKAQCTAMDPDDDDKAVSAWAEHVVHNTGLGNCTNHLKGNFDCTNESASIEKAYSPGSSVFTMEEVAYWIEPSGTDATINALHRDGQEIINGVDGLRFRYGVDDDGDGFPDVFLSASAINASASYEFSEVISISIEVDVSTYENTAIQSQTFSTSVRLRNRGLS
ncbi:PilW family protein [Reinekea blandensis]|uniref:Type IV pilus assembly protein PilW n=1 Tax=Reinekea blandensis MED297 TaxID=314283 RepID=A4BJK6_9GAMM|nr:PilW family protein [Reinekea blandensis]EAR07710.1 type IV pilus assembly protein PilW [Reinekea sp. MED297] [Reinekea blandensis MED297]